VNHRIFFPTSFEGRASELDWSFGDGPTVTNLGAYTSHTWTNTGTYNVTLTAYNLDHSSGVTSNLVVTVVPLLVPSLQSAGVVSNAFQFSFPAQGYAFYQAQYTTNLMAPIAWQTSPQLLFSTTDTVMTVRDPTITNGARFYRVTGQ
jgi:PKD repeat protein